MDFCRLIVRVFDKSSVNSIDFDDFIQVCVMLRILTDKFRVKDQNQNGFIRLHYEQVNHVIVTYCNISFYEKLTTMRCFHLSCGPFF